MDESDRVGLQRNRTKLVRFFATNEQIFYEVCNRLLETDILTPGMMAIIKSYPDAYNRARSFLDTLPRRGPDAMSAFLIALSNFSGTAEIINAVETVRLDTKMFKTDHVSEVPARPYSVAKNVVCVEQPAREQPPSYAAAVEDLPTYEDRPPTYEEACMDLDLTRYYITDQDCVEISGMIGLGWELLGANLGLSHDKVSRIKINNSGDCRKAIQCMLELWKKSSGGGKASDLLEANEGLDAFCGYDVKTYLNSQA